MFRRCPGALPTTSCSGEGPLTQPGGHELAVRGYEVVTVGRTAGDLRFDVTDPAQVTALYGAVDRRRGRTDAVVSAAGDLPFRPLPEMTHEDYTAAFRGKVLSQINLVRQGIPHVTERGSFTMIAGTLSHDPVPRGSAGAMANSAVEAFARAAALEIAPQRINAVSPTIFPETLAAYGPAFPGVPSVDVADVVRAYVRSVEGAQTGQV